MTVQQAQKLQSARFDRQKHDGALAQRFVGEERRRRERVSDAGLAVSFKGATHLAVNWSLGGFVIEGYSGSLIPGSLLSIDAVGKAGGEMTEVAVRARVARADSANHSLAVSFHALDSRAYGVLHGVMSDRMRLLKQRSAG